MLIIPAIDILDGKCVRLYQGNFSLKKEYRNNPLDQAKIFADIGVEHLHLIDLDGAKNGYPKNLNILEQIVNSTALRVDFGGGLRTIDSINDAINAGAWKANVGSLIVENIKAFTDYPYKDKIIAAIDCQDSMVKTNGWCSQTIIKVDEILSNIVEVGIAHATITDISRDGTLTSPAFSLYSQLRQKFPEIMIWASGGVSSLSDIVALQKIKVDGVIIGKAYYENKLDLKTILRCLQNA
ncbi:MAG TPA: HisA/HisF-related TIM barrel protein [Salinivirgaceae bacterium]|nr:HisA/HisF-related TIM barrel protein [Salinivirgaceae bacterium]